MTSSKAPLHGVNLGGWLVLEEWMTPGLFKGTDAKDELDLTLYKGKAHILRHRRDFIKEKDFKWLKQNGVKAIRVPVGYWILEDQDGYVASPDILDWCYRMADKYKIKVLLGLHAAPGSQNRSDHGGNGRGYRPLWFKRANRNRSTDVLIQLVERYKKHPSFWGVSLLNEPTSLGAFRYVKLRVWTRRIIERLRDALPSQVKLVFSDGYVFRLWYKFKRSETIDIHHYQCHSKADKLMTSFSDHISRVDSEWEKYRRMLGGRSYIVGEWTSVLPSTVKKSKKDTQQYISRQVKNFRGAEAIFYWSYKTEHQGGWNYRSMIEKGFKF